MIRLARAMVVAVFSVAAVGCGDGSGGDSEEPIDVTDVVGATLQTSMGDIEVTLFPDRAPETVENFVGLAEGGRATNPNTDSERFYDGTVFHRVIDDFMIQGGDPDADGSGGPGYEFGDEIDPELAFDEPGKLAMANSGPDTNGSQFFLTTVPTPWLDGKHTIFGAVADDAGLDVLAEISKVETDENDKPVSDITLKSVRIHREGD